MLLWACLLWPLFGFAQDTLIPDKHFSLYNGLPAKTLYSMCRDPQGFMWIGAENGVFRFDGKDFYHYDTRDGLCDNEILIIFSDSKGRIWCGGFNGKISLIENGVVNTRPVFIREWNSKGVVRCFGEDSSGYVYASTEKSELFRIHPQHGAELLPTAEMEGNSLIRNIWTYRHKVYLSNTANWYEYDIRSAKLTRQGEYARSTTLGVRVSEDYEALWKVNVAKNRYKNVYTGQEIHLDFTGQDYLRFMSQIDSTRVLFSMSAMGSFVYDMATSRYHRILLPDGAETQDVIWLPEQKQLWLMTVSDGLFSVNLTSTGNDWPIWLHPGNVSDALWFDGQISLSKKGINSLFFGNDSVSLFSWQDTIKDDNLRLKMTQVDGRFRVIGDSLFHSGVMGLYAFKNRKIRYCGNSASIKDFYRYGPNDFFVMAHDGIFRNRNSPTREYFIRERAYAMAPQNNGFWLYFKDGLRYYHIGRDSLYPISYRVPDNGRVVEMKSLGNGILVLCTGNHGLIFLKNGTQVLKSISMDDGLLDNDCRQIEPFGRGWVLRHVSGLSWIDFSGHIRTVSEWKGIPLTLVNRISIHGNQILLACTKGLLHLNIDDLFRELPETRNVSFLRVLSDDKFLPADTVLLEPGRNRLKIDYALPEYRHPEWVLYYWRINGDRWNMTSNKSLEFADLRPGEHRLEVKAKVPGYTYTPVSLLYLRVKQPFWMSPYAIALGVLLVLLLGWSIQRYWYRRQLNKANITHQLMSFEQKALNAMMNPHFVFNAMGSIQYLLTQGDNKRANDYLVKFSRLIRKSLETSQLEFCYLDDEIERITLYLQLEKMRLGTDMDFLVDVDDELDTEHLKIPTLILQTYIENAVIHGMRPGQKLLVEIGFVKNPQGMHVFVRDNGPGFDVANKSKMNRRFGFMATEKRLELLSKITGKTYRMQVLSPLSETGGTEVRLLFPLNKATS